MLQVSYAYHPKTDGKTDVIDKCRYRCDGQMFEILFEMYLLELEEKSFGGSLWNTILAPNILLQYHLELI